MANKPRRRRPADALPDLNFQNAELERLWADMGPEGVAVDAEIDLLYADYQRNGKRGRPPTIEKEQVRKLVLGIRHWCPPLPAAVAAGIPKSSYIDIMADGARPDGKPWHRAIHNVVIKAMAECELVGWVMGHQHAKQSFPAYRWMMETHFKSARTAVTPPEREPTVDDAPAFKAFMQAFIPAMSALPGGKEAVERAIVAMQAELASGATKPKP